MLILVFTSTDYTVARAVGYNIDAAVVFDSSLDDFADRFAGADVTESAETIFVPVLHGLEGVFEDAADCDDEVVLVEAVADETTAHVPCATEDLEVLVHSEGVDSDIERVEQALKTYNPY